MAKNGNARGNKEVWIDRVIAFLGVGMAIYFYIHPYSTRCLTYQIHPVRVPLLVDSQSNSAGSLADGFSASYQGRPVPGPVYSALIAVWNAGSQSVRRNEILEPLAIHTNGTPILGARVLYTTRRVVNWQLDEKNRGQGRIDALWDILEKDDGGIIQVIYAGGRDAALTASAVVEGQREIEKSEEPRYFFSRQKAFLRGLLEIRLAGWGFLALGLAGIYMGLTGLFKSRGQFQPRGLINRTVDTLAIMINLIFFSLGFYMVLLLQDTHVPFPF